MNTGPLPAGWQTQLGACTACGRPVLWAITSRGKRMPLDPVVDPRGTTAVHRDGVGTFRARVVSSDQPVPDPWERLFVPHFATCPRAPRGGRTDRAPGDLVGNVVSLDQHRRRREQQGPVKG